MARPARMPPVNRKKTCREQNIFWAPSTGCCGCRYQTEAGGHRSNPPKEKEEKKKMMMMRRRRCASGCERSRGGRTCVGKKGDRKILAQNTEGQCLPGLPEEEQNTPREGLGPGQTGPVQQKRRRREGLGPGQTGPVQQKRRRASQSAKESIPHRNYLLDSREDGGRERDERLVDL